MRFGEDYELPSETPAGARGAGGALVAAGGGVSGKGAPKGKVTFGSSSKAIKGMLALKVRVSVRIRVRVRVSPLLEQPHQEDAREHLYYPLLYYPLLAATLALE